jgi:hypothetical protein
MKEPSCDFVYPDEPEPPESAPRPLDARQLAQTFVLLARWADRDAARLAIVGLLLGLSELSQAGIARETRIGKNRLGRALAAGREFLSTCRDAQERDAQEQVSYKRSGPLSGI